MEYHLNESMTPNGNAYNRQVMLTRTTWAVCLTVNCLLLLVHLWIAIATVIYAVKTRKSRSSLGGGRVLISAAIATVAPNIRYFTTLSLLMITLHGASNYDCEIVIDTGKATMSIALFFISCFFWVRQRAFYSHPSIGHSFGKCVSVFSFCSIVLLIGLLLIVIPLSIFPREYEAQLSGIKCGFAKDEKPYSFRNYVYGVVSLVTQLMLLGLFAHPLRIHHQTQQMSAASIAPNKNDIIFTLDTVSSTTQKQQVEESISGSPSVKENVSKSHLFQKKIHKNRSQQRQSRVFTLMKRTSILALIAVVTDLITMVIISVVIPPTKPQVVTRIIYDVDLSFNTVTVLLSFENWRTMLWPFTLQVSKFKNQNTQINSFTGEGKINASTIQDL